jgi:UDP-2-acetamido-2,6-beta-L-arabino-hexul-4-ose reductase
MIKVGITGQAGFLGKNFYNTLNLYREKYESVLFDSDYFNDETKLVQFVSSCDVVIHFAAKSRAPDPNDVYTTNMDLVKKLICALEKANSKAHIIYSSSIQEDMDTPYAKSKKEGRLLLAKWSESNGSVFTGLIFPNIFGPLCKPYYASFIATFCHQILHNVTPKIDVDREMGMLYISEAMHIILEAISNKTNSPYFEVGTTSYQTVSGVLQILKSFKKTYVENKKVPVFKTSFEKNLFTTFTSYISDDIKSTL